MKREERREKGEVRSEKSGAKRGGVCAFAVFLILFAFVMSGCASGTATRDTSSSSASSRSTAAQPAAAASWMDDLVDKSYDNLSSRLDSGLRIALMPINGDPSIAGEIYDLITLEFINAFIYDMVERDRLDAVLKEQRFQYSGLVDDTTAAEIGKILGAQVIIIGDLPVGTSRRLAFRALDVQTGKIIAMSSERF